MIEQVHSFAIGDYVKFARKSPGHVHQDHLGREGHITGVTMTQGQLEYAFEGAAWFPHSCFDLIIRATPNALKHVADINRDEDEDEHDDDDSDVYNAEDAEPAMAAACEWFADLDDQLTASPRSENSITVTSRNMRLLEIFDRTTEFNLVHTEPKSLTARSADLKLVFEFRGSHECTVTFYDVNGGDVDEVTYAMLDEFDPFAL